MTFGEMLKPAAAAEKAYADDELDEIGDDDAGAEAGNRDQPQSDDEPEEPDIDEEDEEADSAAEPATEPQPTLQSHETTIARALAAGLKPEHLLGRSEAQVAELTAQAETILRVSGRVSEKKPSPAGASEPPPDPTDDLDPEEYDKRVRDVLAWQKTKIAELERGQQAPAAAAAAAEAQKFVGWFEEKIAALRDPNLGTATLASEELTVAQVKRRREILARMDEIKAQSPAMDDEQILAQSLGGKTVPARSSGKQIEAKREERRKQRLGTPSGPRLDALPHGEKRARAAVAAKLRELGMDD